MTSNPQPHCQHRRSNRSPQSERQSASKLAHVCSRRTPAPKRDKTTTPDRLGTSLGQTPRSAAAEAGPPIWFSHRFLRIAADVVEFRPGDEWVLFWLAINQQPEHQPEETQRTDANEGPAPAPPCVDPRHYHRREHGDRKSTRLNSSHSQISYAVFCLKKKN